MEIKHLIVLGLLCSAPATVTAAPQKFYVDPSQCSASMTLLTPDNKSFSASFANATGMFSYDPDTKSLTNLKIAVDATSLTAGNKNTTHDLRMVFDPNAFPEIGIISTNNIELKDTQTESKVTFKMHGQTKSTPCEMNKTSDTSLSIKCSVKRADFGMSDAPEAAPILGDSIIFLFDLQGTRQ